MLVSRFVKRLGLLVGVAVAAFGCAEPLHLAERGSTPSAYTFWPPPPASDVWLPLTPPVASGARFGAISSELDATLSRAGYEGARWYPIGVEYQHGFVLTTRLEQLDSAAGSNEERWPPTYPDPVSLKWLTIAQSPKLPRAGRYRAFLVAFTDLPLQPSSTPPFWNEHTLMDGPGAPDRRRIAPSAEQRPVTPGFQFGVFEYLYDWDAEQQRGRLRPAAGSAPTRSWPPALGRAQAR